MAVAFISVVLHGTRVTCKLHKITAEVQLPARKAHTELEGRMKKYFFTLYLSMLFLLYSFLECENPI